MVISQSCSHYSDWPLSNSISSTESEDVDGCEAGLSAWWDKHHDWLFGRVLHDGVIHWLRHGQQTSLSVTHIEALCTAGTCEFMCLYGCVENGFHSGNRPGCAAPVAQVWRWGGSWTRLWCCSPTSGPHLWRWTKKSWGPQCGWDAQSEKRCTASWSRWPLTRALKKNKIQKHATSAWVVLLDRWKNQTYSEQLLLVPLRTNWRMNVSSHWY